MRKVHLQANHPRAAVQRAVHERYPATCSEMKNYCFLFMQARLKTKAQ